LRSAYLEIAMSEPARCKVVDAAKGPDEVAQAIWAAVQVLLDPPAAKAGTP